MEPCRIEIMDTFLYQNTEIISGASQVIAFHLSHTYSELIMNKQYFFNRIFEYALLFSNLSVYPF